MTRNRSRVTGDPVLFVTVFRMSSVPKVELFAGSEVKSRMRFGGLELPTAGSRLPPAIWLLRWTGLDRFSGPGAPSRWPAPALVPLVSTKMKSGALLPVSMGKPPVGQAPSVVIDPDLPQLSR